MLERDVILKYKNMPFYRNNAFCHKSKLATAKVRELDLASCTLYSLDFVASDFFLLPNINISLGGTIIFVKSGCIIVGCISLFYRV